LYCNEAVADLNCTIVPYTTNWKKKTEQPKVGGEIINCLWNIEEIPMYQKILVPLDGSKQAAADLPPRHEVIHTHMIIREISRRSL
jgi:hypothetical protein